MWLCPYSILQATLFSLFALYDDFHSWLTQYFIFLLCPSEIFTVWNCKHTTQSCINIFSVSGDHLSKTSSRVYFKCCLWNQHSRLDNVNKRRFENSRCALWDIFSFKIKECRLPHFRLHCVPWCYYTEIDYFMSYFFHLQLDLSITPPKKHNYLCGLTVQITKAPAYNNKEK